MSDFTPIQVVSFDCYGTLVDRDRGLFEALALECDGTDPTLLQRLITAQAAAEWTLICQLESYILHRELLARSLVEAAATLAIALDERGAARVAASIGRWPLFADTLAALARMAKRYRLAIVSNVDREELDETLNCIGLPFARTITADKVQCYKPEPDHLLALLHELELDEDELLQVSAFPEYDLETAQDLGVPCAYLDRRDQTPPEELALRYRAPDLTTLADLLLRRPRQPRRPPRRPTRRR